MRIYNPEQELARALHQALSSDAGLQSVIGNEARLYDFVPEDPIFPYVSYGELRSVDESGDACQMMAHVMSLHVWSQYGGRLEVLDIFSHIRRVLETSILEIQGGRVVGANVIYADVFRASDGRRLHGILRISIKTQPVFPTLEEVA